MRVSASIVRSVFRAVVLSRAVCVTVCVTVGNTICPIRVLNRPVLIDAFFKEQGKGDDQIYITGSLVPENISKLMCNPSIIPILPLLK